MAIDLQALSRLFRKHVAFKIYSDGHGSDMVDLEGKILAVTSNGLAVKSGSDTKIIGIDDVASFEEIVRIRKKRVTRRWVRVIGRDSSVRQHLADRHGVLVSVLNAIDEETAHEMHDRLNHSDLGHRHRSAEDRMKDLDPDDEDDEPDEDDED